MTRFAILTAGGDTPALNATIYGAVERANALKIEMVGLIRGFAGILDPRVPHVRLNPLFSTIPELNPNMGGTLLGASRTYIVRGQADSMSEIKQRLQTLKVDGMICIGGDGTINEVVNGIISAGQEDVVLGVLPVGTMNVFASELAIPQNSLEKAWQIIQNGSTHILPLTNCAPPPCILRFR